MTNEEKIRELLNEPCWKSEPYLIGMDKVGVEDVMERFADWKDEQHAQEKRQWIERMLTLTNVTKSETAKERKRTKFKQNLKTTFRNLIERILDATEKMCVITLVLFLWLCAIGLVVVGINVLFNLL